MMRLKSEEKVQIVAEIKGYVTSHGEVPDERVVREIAYAVVGRARGREDVALSDAVIEELHRAGLAEVQEAPVAEVQEARLCLCGCGQPVNKGKWFKQGHDSKLHSILKKVEEGELDESAIPEAARNQLVPCICCGQLIIPHESGKGPVCRTGKCKCIRLV